MTDTLEEVALADVVVDINVRTDVKLDKSFVSSIRNHGIIQPPVGWRDDDGKVHITAGQRRTLAAMEIGAERIDVVIKPQEIAEAARVVTQLTENDQRQQLTDSERLHGYKQLAMFGVSIDQIARKTNKPKQHVETAIAVSNSTIATEALAAMPIDLEQAATIAEFETDPEAVDRLLQIAGERPEQIAHEAQRIRDIRAFEAAKAEAEAKYSAEGWEILETRPSWEDKTVLSLEHLWREDDDKRQRITEEQASSLDGRAVYVGQPGWQDREDGRPISIGLYVRDWKAQGLTTHESYNGSTKGPLTDEEKAARKIERQVGADLRSATTVRREWLKTTLLADRAKIDIPSAVDLIATALLGLETSQSDGKVYTIAAELLGLEVAPPKGMWDDTPRAAVRDHFRKGADPLRVALAVAIARTESVVGDPSWKSARESETTREYYRQLEEWGYELSDVEASIAKKGRKK